MQNATHESELHVLVQAGDSAEKDLGALVRKKSTWISSKLL